MLCTSPIRFIRVDMIRPNDPHHAAHAVALADTAQREQTWRIPVARRPTIYFRRRCLFATFHCRCCKGRHSSLAPAFLPIDSAPNPEPYPGYRRITVINPWPIGRFQESTHYECL